MRKAERWRREVFRMFRALRLEKNSSTELFGESPNYSVCYRIIRSTELFSPPPIKTGSETGFFGQNLDKLLNRFSVQTFSNSNFSLNKEPTNQPGSKTGF